ncbi:MAG: N-6 DNA methylase [Spirochaetes bacterium]|nr:N-6 DNA methylase [Spirochaetota bacterium]
MKSGKLLVEQKVEDFHKNEKMYLDKSFQETEARNRFIDPLFMALGWEFDQTGIQRRHWDVHREFSQRDNSSTKKPDYAFRINGKVKFFVEAKAPWVPLTEKGPVFQAKRYAFSTGGKTPIVVLTDFQEFRVFNSMARPIFDNPLQGLIKDYDFKYTDFPDKWDRLYGMFSKEAVLEGSLDLLAGKISKSTKSLDTEFLADITQYRETLAKNIALRNKALSVDEINEAVQRILDRLIFIRNIEDRGIEEEGLLMRMAETKDDDAVYKSLIPVFQRLDGAYNGLLFKKHFSEDLAIDGKAIKGIVKSLCWPESPFQFDIIEPEILGRIYEKFLGSKIRLTGEHRAKVEEKPEVRKAGGVYYTPEYIVRYIVENTVGEAVKGLSPEQIGKIKILDPACGSGSFLIGALDYLIEYHRHWYSEHRAEKKYKDHWYETPEGEVNLTIQKKREILTGNIYGVDIDREATEVAIMSLYLKLLEEGFDKGEAQLFVGTLLPDMTKNIRCGNSLIGSDYYDGRDLKLFSDEEFKSVNAFDWADKNGFPEVMKSGGFDCVIGNPPYVRQEMISDYKEYFQSHFKAYHGVADLYAYFIEKGVSLLKPGGRFSYIVANKWMRANYGGPLRELLLKSGIAEIIDFGDLPVFQDATTYPCIITVAKGKTGGFDAAKVGDLDFIDLRTYLDGKRFAVSTSGLNNEGWSLSDEKTANLLEKIKSKGVPLGEYVGGKIYYGIKTGLNEAFVIDAETRERLIKEDPKSAEIIKPFLAGRDIKRYETPVADKYLIFTRRGIKINDYPAIKEYLSQYKKQLEPGTGRKPGSYQWYEIQDTVAYYEEFEKPKIIVPAIVQNASYLIDNNSNYSNDKTTIIRPNDKSSLDNEIKFLFLLVAILNSKVSDYIIYSIASTKQGGYYEYKPMYISQIPIPLENVSNDKKQQLASLTLQMIETKKEKLQSQSELALSAIRKKADLIDRQIDALVYELYGLTEEEIKIVENMCK